MGVSITCRKTGRTIDMGGGGFLRLRRKVSELQGGPFHDIYEEVCSWYPGCTAEAADEFDARINARIEELLADEDKTKRPDIKIIDFLLQTDVGGRIRYGACKNILKVIGDYDDNILYGYCGRPDCARFADFKAILQDCVDTKSDMIWS
ncbi:hypothetical protein [Intestinimonas massiliensis (ex Afouda et al. 2020)]|jgi:hypothetical protein|uniref:Uncharacterized protein n=1 Tax=Intestinimonas massiliensis (ex Afouda et al. 2020) TaxID=1673721 RepID=A0ABS9M6F4_9FIRM|nr:hypothetical protein [Intestinimonas massiliensis (ex Afouda et al. 2020)]MCG4526346.1 hypothetical protein [Intestinimonas massiliensis (ex Afouda et al. 2020)]